MQTQIENLAEKLWMYDFAVVRSAYILRIEREHESINNIIATMINDGWDIVETENEYLTDDGRYIAKINGKKLALRPEVQALRMKEAFANEETRKRELEKQREESTNSHLSLICPAIIDGQLCGGNISATPVCPKCSLGKHGVIQVLTCDVCGAQTAVMR